MISDSNLVHTHSKRELLAGLTTFMTMSYIIVVNPLILSHADPNLPFSGVLTATVLLGALMTLAMGLYARLPYAIAPGMGFNAFFAYTLVVNGGIPCKEAFGLLFWAGLFFLIASLTPLRVAIAKAVPVFLRHAAAVGIGIFLAFIGLKNCSFLISSPVTFVKSAPINPQIFLALCGLLLIIVLSKRYLPIAMIVSLSAVTAASLALGYVTFPDTLFSAPDFSSLMFSLDIMGGLQWRYLPMIVALMLTGFFDSLSSFMALAQTAGMVDKNGHPVRLKEGLIVDACSSLFAGLFGTSPGTVFLESAAGIQVGGRRGFTAVVAGLCFLPFLFIAPLAHIVPAYATAPILVYVGGMMFKNVIHLPVQKVEEALPCFLTVILIPLTFSVTQGILWGFLSYPLLFLLVGRGKEVHGMMYGVGAVCALLLVIQQWF